MKSIYWTRCDEVSKTINKQWSQPCFDEANGFCDKAQKMIIAAPTLRRNRQNIVVMFTMCEYIIWGLQLDGIGGWACVGLRLEWQYLAVCERMIR